MTVPRLWLSSTLVTDERTKYSESDQKYYMNNVSFAGRYYDRSRARVTAKDQKQ